MAKPSSRSPSWVAAETSRTRRPWASSSGRTISASSRASGTSILLMATTRVRSVSGRPPSASSTTYAASSASIACRSLSGSRPGLEGGGVDDVDEHGAPLDVTQELQPEAAALARARDQARHVGDGEPLAARLDHAEVGHQRGERVVGDLGPRRRHRGDQARLAGAREAHEGDVGQRLELELDVAGIARLPQQGEAGGLAAGRGQGGVAQAAAATVGDDERRTHADQVDEDLAVGRLHDGALGDRQDQVGALGAVAVAALAGLAVDRRCGAGGGGTPAASSTCGSTSRTMSPPRPPLPPSGPPSGLNFSRWTEAQPLPPSPAARCSTTRSTNVVTGVLLCDRLRGV